MNGPVFQRGGIFETDLCVATGLVTDTGDENNDRFVGDITPDIELILGYVNICCKKYIYKIRIDFSFKNKFLFNER